MNINIEDLNKIPRHGTLIKYEGIGVLLAGNSGIGKSECALNLIDAGALLVCDDAPIFTVEKGKLIGQCNKKYIGHIHLRQLGIIYLPDYFPNQQTYCDKTELNFIIQFHPANDINDIPIVVDKPDYHQLNIADKTIPILNYYIFPNTNLSGLIKIAIKQYMLSL